MTFKDLKIYIGFGLLALCFSLIGIYLPIKAMLADPNLGNWTYSSEWALELTMIPITLGLMFLLIVLPLMNHLEDMRHRAREGTGIEKGKG